MSTVRRTCALTGVRLVAARPRPVYRVARTSYGPLNPAPRTPASVHTAAPAVTLDTGAWGRFDTLGRTAYFADTPQGAYAEVLGQFKRLDGQVDPLAKDAAARGMSVEDLIAEMEADDPECLTLMHVGHLPRSWRERRELYRVQLPAAGWWIDVEHGDTLAALDRLLARMLPFLGCPTGVTVADLLGENRALTTTVAMTLREILLDDGSQPLGITHRSKRGWSTNYAWWMRHADLAIAPSTTDAQPLDAAPISNDDPDLAAVAHAYRLTIH